MVNYGTEFIKHFFKKWRKRPAICPVFESKIQADSDRSHIRMFETGLSIERYGDYEQGSRDAAQKAESLRLIEIAKENKLYFTKEQWTNFGERKRLPSGESIIYLDKQEKYVIKVRDPFAKAGIKSLHPEDVIYEHLIHNILFPSTRYDFLGISEDYDGVRIILRQPYLSRKFISPTQLDIDAYLIDGLGLHIEDRYFYANDYIAITDVSADGDNVLTDGENLFFIDPIIKFKKAGKLVLDYYYKLQK